MNKTITTLLFMISTSLCIAQGNNTISKQSSFQLNLGLNQLKEENLHPKVHSGMIYGLNYSNSRTSLRQKIFQLAVHFSKPKTKFESLAASMNLQLYGSYSFLFHEIKKNNFTVCLGPELDVHYNLSHYPNWDESHLYWSNYLSLRIHNKLRYQLNTKQLLTLNFSIPVFSVISRPELNRMYKIDNVTFGGIIENMHSNLEGACWNHSFALKSNLEYQFTITEKITQAICYSFNYFKMRASEGFPFQSTQHLIGLKLYY